MVVIRDIIFHLKKTKSGEIWKTTNIEIDRSTELGHEQNIKDILTDFANNFSFNLPRSKYTIFKRVKIVRITRQLFLFFREFRLIK